MKHALALSLKSALLATLLLKPGAGISGTVTLLGHQYKATVVVVSSVEPQLNVDAEKAYGTLWLWANTEAGRVPIGQSYNCWSNSGEAITQTVNSSTTQYIWGPVRSRTTMQCIGEAMLRPDTQSITAALRGGQNSAVKPVSVSIALAEHGQTPTYCDDNDNQCTATYVLNRKAASEVRAELSYPDSIVLKKSERAELLKVNATSNANGVWVKVVPSASIQPWVNVQAGNAVVDFAQPKWMANGSVLELVAQNIPVGVREGHINVEVSVL
ncbi:hypothetical protein [Vagococcus sp. WN89Y]|uniref:hypothetical protein n=1 Tax=Vagococcus sp. WN89Y TaxID=3457258 RepID=UPI003FCCC15C